MSSTKPVQVQSGQHAAELLPDEPAQPSAALLEEVLAQSAAPSGIVVGELVEIGEAGTSFVVQVPGHGRIHATYSLVPIMPGDLGRAAAVNVPATPGAAAVLVGFVWTPAPMSGAAAPSVQADGKRLEIRAEKEIELRCGEAAIVLTSDGRIYLRGHYVTSHATATQRILGGSVNVN